MSNFNKRNCQTFPKRLYHFVFPPGVYEGSSFSTSLPTFVFITNFYLSNSDMRSWVISHCGFNFHSPNGWWCWTSFHVLICHLYIFFGEVFQVQVFYPFFTWIVDFLLLRWESSLNFLDTNPLCHDLQIFLPLCHVFSFS